MAKNKAIVLSVIASLTLMLLLIGATYAYFQAKTDSGSPADVKVQTYTVDVLSFETGDPLSFTIDQDNFAKDQDSLSASTFASATLSANNKTNTATDHYYMYLNISNNSFIYTQDVNTPEMILTITSASGTPLTSIDGLTYKEVTDNKGTKISGFDITTKNGLIPLLSNKEISANPKTEEKWNVTITFVNYNLDQSKNAGKDFTAKLMIQKEKMAQFLSDVCSSGSNLASCIKTYSNKGSSITNIYYHDSNLENGANDNSYRYAGASDQVNNFICFGSSVTPCPTDNLYRIIGVFGDRVKLIKSDYATSALLGTDENYKRAYTAAGWINSNYKGNNLANVSAYNWNKSAQNTWSLSNLNKTNLNQNFITNIGAEWANKIDMTTWKVGGNTSDNISNQPAKTAYQNEIVNPVTTNSTDNKTEYSAKIGLMYASDYGFAAAPSAWTTQLSSYNGEAIKNVNWLYMGLYEWTISRNANDSDYVFRVDDSGYVYGGSANFAFGVRPVFYLSSSVNYVSGSGGATDPITIN